jgi:hypothetical protein
MEINEYGSGLICPFQRDGKGDFVNGNGLAVLKTDIAELIGIRGPTMNQPGELPWDTEIGSRVMALRHRGMHTEMTRATAEQFVSEPVRKWEPRARPGKTEVVIDDTEQSITIKFSYIPVGSRTYETVTMLIPGE